MMKIHLISAALAAATLIAGCGGSVGNAPMRKFTVSEANLAGATGKTDGEIVGPGSGLVVLQLEPAGGLPAPLSGDTATIGVDHMWFDVDNPGRFSVKLDEAALADVFDVAIIDANGKVLMQANRAHTVASVDLPRGRYFMRATAVPGALDVALVMSWFGGDAGLANAAAVAQLATGNCNGCNLRGANLVNATLRGANLANADLRGAIAFRAPGGLALLPGEVFKLLLGADVLGVDATGANLAGAALSGAWLSGSGSRGALLSGANLSAATVTDTWLAHADLTGTNLSNGDFSRSTMVRAVMRGANLANARFVGTDLSGVDLAGANLENANFSGAKLDGAAWPDGRICAPRSVTTCQ